MAVLPIDMPEAPFGERRKAIYITSMVNVLPSAPLNPLGPDQSFRDQGVVGPIRVLTQAECALLDSYVEQGEIRKPLAWFKGYACSDPLIYSIATRQDILDIVERLLGPDLYLWGASLVVKKPGEAHPWHTDVETSNPEGRFVTVWIGISNTSIKSALQFIEQSHLIGMPLQEVAALFGVSRAERCAETSLALGKRHRSSCSLSHKDIQDGEGFFFDGRIWHGSLNAGEVTRKALLLQYAPCSCAIRIPNFQKLDYPFEYTNRYPPSVMVRGRQRGVKNIVSPPSQAWKRLRTGVLKIRPEPDDQPWTARHLFRGATTFVDVLGAHYSTLKPGHCPHPPHKHIEEEFLIIIHGVAEVVVGDDMRTHTMRSGDFAYYPAYYSHTIRNVSDTPVVYLMLKWRGAFVGSEHQLKAGVFVNSEQVSGQADKDFRTKLIFEGPTHFLRKLHVHRSYVIRSGYAPHEDEYDVLVILLAGAVSTMGKIIEAPALLYHPARTTHGLRSVGDRAADYVVVEMHGTRKVEQQSITSKLKRVPQHFALFAHDYLRRHIPIHVRQRLKRFARLSQITRVLTFK